MKDEVFFLHNAYHVIFNGVVVRAEWQERGPAEAQLSLPKSGYSVLTSSGGVKHTGAQKAVRCPECGSQRISQPDKEGLVDCCDCGIWFDPTHPNNIKAISATF